MWMNRMDVEEARALFDRNDTPNLSYAAESLAALVEWTDANSDGWPYWVKPSKAADQLQRLLSAHTYAARFGHYQGTGNRLHDVTEGDVARALKPVKAFLTRQGADHKLVLS